MMKLIRRFRARKTTKREIHKLLRKLPLFVPRTADLSGLARLISRVNFKRRSERLHARYVAGKMTYAKWVKYERALGDREIVVNSIEFSRKG